MLQMPSCYLASLKIIIHDSVVKLNSAEHEVFTCAHFRLRILKKYLVIMHFRRRQPNLLKATLLKQATRKMSVVDLSVASEFVDECSQIISSENFDFETNVVFISDFLRLVINQTNAAHQPTSASSQEQLVPEGEAPVSPSPPPVLPQPPIFPPAVSPEPSEGSLSSRSSLGSSSSGEQLVPATVRTSSSSSSSSPPQSMLHPTYTDESVSPSSPPVVPSSSAENLGASDALHFANPATKEELGKLFKDVLVERFRYFEESARKHILTQIMCLLRLPLLETTRRLRIE